MLLALYSVAPALRFAAIRSQFRAMSSAQLPNDSSLPGEHFEVRQTSSTDDYKPNPSKSLPLNSARQALLDDILALYSCEPTRRRVERYTADCVYDDQFVYANDRYKMAGQWFALPKLFHSSKNEGYEVVKNDPLLIQFKNEQVSIYRTRLSPLPFSPSYVPVFASSSTRPLYIRHANGTYPILCPRNVWTSRKPCATRPLRVPSCKRTLILARQTWTFPGNIKSTTINALVSLSLDPATAESDFIQIKYHKDQANGKDYSHTGPGFAFKKFQADKVAGMMDSPDVQAFKADAREDNREDVRKYESGTDAAPQKNF